MATRFLYLIRHGQYDREDTSAQAGRLTNLGREQARLTAERVRSLPITAIYCSTLRRAIETAEALTQSMPGVPVRRSKDLCECVPCVPPTYARYFTDVTPEEIAEGEQQARRAFDRRFKRTRGDDRHEIVVCHGNLIRSFVCQALKIPLDTWMQFGSHNCGVTKMLVEPDGERALISYNDVGHLPIEMQTF